MYTLKANIWKIANTPEVRLKLAAALKVSENTIRNYINKLSDDLTKYAALVVLSKEAGKPIDQLVTKSSIEVKEAA